MGLKVTRTSQLECSGESLRHLGTHFASTQGLDKHSSEARVSSKPCFECTSFIQDEHASTSKPCLGSEIKWGKPKQVGHVPYGELIENFRIPSLAWSDPSFIETVPQKSQPRLQSDMIHASVAQERSISIDASHPNIRQTSGFPVCGNVPVMSLLPAYAMRPRRQQSDSTSPQRSRPRLPPLVPVHDSPDPGLSTVAQGTSYDVACTRWCGPASRALASSRRSLSHSALQGGKKKNGQWNSEMSSHRSRVMALEECPSVDDRRRLPPLASLSKQPTRSQVISYVAPRSLEKPNR